MRTIVGIDGAIVLSNVHIDCIFFFSIWLQ